MTTSFRLESGRVVIKIGSSLATLNGVPRTAWLSVLGEEIGIVQIIHPTNASIIPLTWINRKGLETETSIMHL